MQDPNNPDDEEFFEGEFDHEFDAFDEFSDVPDETTPLGSTAEEGGESEFGSGSFEETDWDDFDDGPEEEAGNKRKTNLRGGLSFNTIVIGVAVIVGLGVLIYQVVSTPAPGSGASRFQSVLDFTGSTDGPVLGRQEQHSPGTEMTDLPQQEAGFLDNPDMLAGGAAPFDPALDGGLPMPSPISNDIDEQGLDQQTASAQEPDILTPLPDLSFSPSQGVPRGPDDASLSDQQEEAVSSPAMDVIRRAQMQQQQTQAPAAPASLEEEPAPIVPPAVTEIAETVAPAQPVPTPAETPASPPPADTSAQDAVLKRLDALADRLSVMEQQIVQLRESGQTDLEGLEKEIAALRSGVAAAAPASSSAASSPQRPAPQAAAAPAPAPQRAASRPAPRAAPSAVPSTAAGTWELRAAQPGRAWVSRPGSREMQSVAPGDTLSGIGQIVRIDYANGRWTVVGTQGQIRQ